VISTVSTYTCDKCGSIQNNEGWTDPDNWIHLDPPGMAPSQGFCSWPCVRAHADHIIRKQEQDEGVE